MKSCEFALDDAIADHESVFDISDLCECLDQEILDALRDGDECAAGHLLHRNMRQLIRDRATLDCDD